MIPIAFPGLAQVLLGFMQGLLGSELIALGPSPLRHQYQALGETV